MNTRTTRALLDSRQKRLYFFQNLLLVATADGYLDEQEGNFLLDIGQQLELSSEDVEPIIANYQLLTFIIPETGLERTFELQTLVLMMMEDGRIDEREYALCLEYATRIGYGRAFLDDLVQKFSPPAGASSAPDTAAAEA
jgi:uncharacterized membrane protein YebE (DUF533 family)